MKDGMVKMKDGKEMHMKDGQMMMMDRERLMEGAGHGDEEVGGCVSVVGC